MWSRNYFEIDRAPSDFSPLIEWILTGVRSTYSTNFETFPWTCPQLVRASTFSLKLHKTCRNLQIVPQLILWKRLQNTGSVTADSKILVLGAGIIGNLWMSLLHHFGHRKVIVSEPSRDRRNIADGLSKYNKYFN